MAHSRFNDTITNRVLDLLLGSSHDTTAMPATVYVAGVTTAPSDANGTGLVEASGTSYARVAVTNNDTNWPAASGRSKSNGTAVTFPTSGASWGTWVGFALYDAATGGNFLAYGDMSSSQAVGSGITPAWSAGTLTVASPSS